MAGCTSGEKKEPASEAATPGMPKAPMFHGKVAGITWAFPNTWTVGTQRPMRSATYMINPVQGDTDSAECAVFYFGPTSGGGTEANIQRWAGQFTQPDGSPSMDKAKIAETESNGIKVTTIDLSGTYHVASGPMMQVTDTKEGYRLLGAIAEGPEGSVFFKMTGPKNTMAANEEGFRRMIASIKTLSM
jgi:hypothetical protein